MYDSNARVFLGKSIVLCFALIFPIYYLVDQSSKIRLILYFIPIIITLQMLIIGSKSKLEIDLSIVKLLIAFSGLVLITLPSSNFGFGAISEYLFFVGAVICFIGCPKFSDNDILLLLSSFTCTMVAEYLFFNNNIGQLSFNLASSSGVAEGSYGLLISSISIYYYSQKNYKMFFISLILAFLAYKRIALAGVLLSIMFYQFIFVVENFKKHKLKRLSRYCLFTTIIFVSFLTFFFCDFIDLLFKIGFIEDKILSTSGRYNIMYLFYDKITWDSVSMLIGNGIGASGEFVKSLSFTGFPFIGNEWLRFFFDYGLIGFLIIGYYLFKFYNKTYMAYPFFVFMILVATTEATFIFMFDSLMFMIIVTAINDRGLCVERSA